jgi:site-specific recombinase XerD
VELKSKSVPLSASNIKLEFNRDPKKRIQQNNKSIFDWYPEFITAKENEIGEGINSYRSTHQHFKTFAAGRGVIHLRDLTKQVLEEFRNYLEELNLGGPTVHKGTVSHFLHMTRDRRRTR